MYRTVHNDTEGVKEDNIHHGEDGKCTIGIDLNSLNEENRKIAEELFAEGTASYSNCCDNEDLCIFVKCNCNETVDEVSNRLMKVVSRFSKQAVLHNLSNNEDIKSDLNSEDEFGVGTR